jgi:hypothetical protein
MLTAKRNLRETIGVYEAVTAEINRVSAEMF